MPPIIQPVLGEQLPTS